MKAIKRALVFLPLSTLPFTVNAASQQSIYQIENQLRQLEARYAADSNELRQINALLKQLEQKRRKLRLAKKTRRGRRQHTDAKAHVIHHQQPHPVAHTKRAPVAASAAPSMTRAVAGQAPVTVVPAVKVVADRPATEQDASPVVKTAPASRSAQSIYEQQHATFDKRWALETGLTYSHYDRKQMVLNGFLALDAIFLGQIKVDSVKADVTTLDLTGRYTVNNRLQLDLNAPFLYRSSTYQSGSSDTTEIREATVTMAPKVGDINAGIYYQLMQEQPGRPDIIWNARLKAPTGTSPYGIPLVAVPGSNGNVNIPATLASGSGVWTVSTGLSLVKTVDPAILFANISYFHNPDRHFNNIAASETPQPGDISLGDSFQHGAGIAFAVNDKMSLSFSYLQRITRKSQTRADGGHWADVIGSDANAATLNLGTTYAISDRESAVFNVGAGLTPDAPNLQLNAKIVSSF